MHISAFKIIAAQRLIIIIALYAVRLQTHHGFELLRGLNAFHAYLKIKTVRTSYP